MMRRHKGKAIISVFLIVMLLCVFGTSAMAADSTIDFTKKGSVTISLKATNDDYIAGAELRLYQVANIQRNQATLNYLLTEGFADSGISLQNLNADNLAEHLCAYAVQNNLPYYSDVSNRQGTVKFDDLTLGLYLVVQAGSVSGYYQISPFLVAVPMTDSEESAWVYSISATPKVEPEPIKPTDSKSLTVEKKWDNGGKTVPEKITVKLLRDGITFDSITLSDKNTWHFEWNNLDAAYQWSVVEDPVPDGYSASYSITGNTVTILNTAESVDPDLPVRLTVNKIWSGNGKEQPDSISVQLLNGDQIVETITLGAWNNWSYTWNQLDASGQWQVRETNVPKGYTASYSRSGNTITITNTETLIQTGQLNWPIPILAGGGLVLLLLGWVLIIRKKNQNGV